MRRPVAIALIVAGIVLFVTGEILGATSPEDWDTVTEYVTWAGRATGGVATAAVVVLLGWAAYHFVDDYRSKDA